MPRHSIWNAEHADWVSILIGDGLSANDIAVRMSKHFRTRITPAQVNNLLVRMRKPEDALYRPNIPYRRGGAKYQG